MKIIHLSVWLWIIGATCGAIEAAERVMTPTDNVRITFSRGRDVDDVKGGSIGEKMASFQPSVKITNSAIHDFVGNKVCVIMMGEDATSDNTWRVIFKEEFDMDLPSGATFEWAGTPFKQGFDRTLSMGGYDYDGYIVLIRNSEGKIAVTAATKTYWLADPEKAWQLVKDKDYDKKFFRK